MSNTKKQKKFLNRNKKTNNQNQAPAVLVGAFLASHIRKWCICLQIKDKDMIRSTKCSLRLANKNKQLELCQFIDEYRDVCQFFVNELWGYVNVPKLAPKKITDRANTWLSARAIQCAAKQASGIVRGTRKKQEQRKWKLNQLLELGELKKAATINNAIERNKISKPNCKTLKPELDSRFVRFDDDNETSFDAWVTLSSIGQRKKIVVPIRKTKHYNKLEVTGTLKKCLRISESRATLMFELPDVEEKQSGDTLGLDVGITNVFSMSNGVSSTPDNHKHTLVSIQNKMCRKQKGSNAFRKCQTQRTNFINWSINQLNLSNVKELRIENLKDVRRNKRTSRNLSHWTYPAIKDKIQARCEENGVRLTLLPYAYSSQRCSKCGWTQRANRNGKRFVCKNCEYAADADFNASVNIGLNLPEFPRSELRQRKNLNGFFYAGQELIVPVGQKLEV